MSKNLELIQHMKAVKDRLHQFIREGDRFHITQALTYIDMIIMVEENK